MSLMRPVLKTGRRRREEEAIIKIISQLKISEDDLMHPHTKREKRVFIRFTTLLTYVAAITTTPPIWCGWPHSLHANYIKLMSSFTSPFLFAPFPVKTILSYA